MSRTLKVSIQFTDSAIKKIKNLIQNNKNLKLRVYITGGGCSGFRYGFLITEDVDNEDFLIKKQGITVVVDPMSFQYLLGSLIDYREELQGSHFVVLNPHAKTTCRCGSSFSI